MRARTNIHSQVAQSALQCGSWLLIYLNIQVLVLLSSFSQHNEVTVNVFVNQSYHQGTIITFMLTSTNSLCILLYFNFSTRALQVLGFFGQKDFYTFSVYLFNVDI